MSITSEIEDTLERIKKNPDVKAFLILGTDGQVIRESESLQDDHDVYSKEILELTAKARSVVRDLNPQNDLTFLRLRTTMHEVLIAPEKEYILIVVQKMSQSK
mmetsp:Transcript_7880/g.11690  ORF Transcript_7880/g.11690 Transcript_7880/m.11690 type:complete len:103 (-) Transcript_7880:30-338(-)